MEIVFRFAARLMGGVLSCVSECECESWINKRKIIKM